jgi:uncharacterized protein (DUF2147 family)
MIRTTIRTAFRSTARTTIRFAALALIAVLMPLTAVPLFAQDADAVLGKWHTEGDKAIIEITKSGSTYAGKIISIKDPLDKEGKVKLDKENPDPSKRSQPIIGLALMSGFSYSSGQWINGTIYDAENGKTYNCKMYMNGADLEVRGYVLGLPFLGRSQIWTRTKKS